ncbi:MAG: hypothetical protein V2J24_17770 [Pseudomonadales bacterium]|nr:hypothetical protein [Pseudomonadales bacterium]
MTLRIRPSRYRRNIANDFAHDLLDALSPDRPSGCEASVARDAVRVTLVLDRHWEAREDADGRGMPFGLELSGHATLFVASLREWKHRSRPTFVRERFHRGWQPEDVARGIFEGMEELRGSEIIAGWRERVFDEMQAREISEALPERIDDHPTRFEEMTIEDCEFWIAWLRKLPLQPFVYRAPLPWRPGSTARSTLA